MYQKMNGMHPSQIFNSQTRIALVTLISLMHQKQPSYKRMIFANLFISFWINSRKMDMQEIRKELDFKPECDNFYSEI